MQHMARSKKNNYPTLLGLPHSENTIKAWCPFCEDYHVHGKMEGYYSAHCHLETSPFKKTGYYIKFETVKKRNSA